MINLKTVLVEQANDPNQFYDIGKDFSSFRRSVDQANAQIKQKIEQAINGKLSGKRILAKASRGYKQFVKIYEFDVSRVSIDDYYGNFVVVAKDNSSPKSKEYFISTGFQIKILGAATGKPSPQKGDKPANLDQNKQAEPPQPSNIAPQQPVEKTPPQEQPLKETSSEEKLHDAYSKDKIVEDVKGWLKGLLEKPETSLEDFIPSIGWQKQIDGNFHAAIFTIKLPKSLLKPDKEITSNSMQQFLALSSNDNVSYKLTSLKYNSKNEEWYITIKKTTKR